MMKNLFIGLCLSLVLAGGTSCLKDDGCQNKTVQSEDAAISAYAAANGIVGTRHSSGVVYQLTVSGVGQTPTPASQITLRYTGKLLDGTVFDSQTAAPVNFNLGGTIPGFQIGLQQVSEGGTIKFIIPSSLAYGCTGSGSIPSNSILFFEVQLIDVN